MAEKAEKNPNTLVLDILAAWAHEAAEEPAELSEEEKAQGVKRWEYTEEVKQLAYDIYQEAGSRILKAEEHKDQDEDQWEVLFDIVKRRLMPLGEVHKPE